MTAPPASAADVRGVYRRLLGYARPWRGLFLIGVLYDLWTLNDQITVRNAQIAV